MAGPEGVEVVEVGVTSSEGELLTVPGLHTEVEPLQRLTAVPGLGPQGTEQLGRVEVGLRSGTGEEAGASAGVQTLVLGEEVVLVTAAAAPPELDTGVPRQGVVVPGELSSTVPSTPPLQAVRPARGLVVGLHDESLQDVVSRHRALISLRDVEVVQDNGPLLATALPPLDRDEDVLLAGLLHVLLYLRPVHGQPVRVPFLPAEIKT